MPADDSRNELLTWVADTLGADAPPPAQALPAEASHRTFLRVADGERTLIAMAAPPALEQNDQFVTLARVFARAGVPVPDILASDSERGFFLMSDLGTRDLAGAYADGEQDTALAAALATLADIARVRDPAIPDYLPERFRMELGIFEEWLVDGLLGARLEPAPLADTWQALLDNVAAQPRVCVHRDYHCRNLLYGRDGRFGVVDFQDALIGPALYDPASLLHDCYHAFDDATVDRWLRAWLARNDLPGTFADARRQLDLTAVQRQLKAIGIFARLEQRDGKSSHLPWIVPVATRAAALCGRYPETTWLGRELARLIPLVSARLNR